MSITRTVTTCLGLGLGLLTTSLQAAEWTYEEVPASKALSGSELLDRSRDGWRVADIGKTRDGHLFVLGRSDDAATGRDAERETIVKRTKLATLVDDLNDVGSRGFIIDTLVSDDDDGDSYSFIASRPKYGRVASVSGLKWEFKVVELDPRRSSSRELDDAGRDGYLAFEMITNGDSLYAVLFRDAGVGARKLRYTYRLDPLTGDLGSSLTRVARGRTVLAMASLDKKISVLTAEAPIGEDAAYEYTIVNGGYRADDAVRALNKAGKDGWKLMDIDEGFRDIQLLMSKKK